MTCKDCVHYDVCDLYPFDELPYDCPYCKPESRFVEMKHGRWEDGYSVDSKGRIVYKSIDCSNCHEVFKTEETEYWKDKFAYCPFCGAKMEVGE